MQLFSRLRERIYFKAVLLQFTVDCGKLFSAFTALESLLLYEWIGRDSFCTDIHILFPHIYSEITVFSKFQYPFTKSFSQQYNLQFTYCFRKINNPDASIGAQCSTFRTVCSIRWLQSVLIPFVTTQSVGVLNPPRMNKI